MRQMKVNTSNPPPKNLAIITGIANYIIPHEELEAIFTRGIKG